MARNRSGATAPAVKGNIVVGTGTDTSAVLAVGANGTTLVADSAEATGLKWATPSAGSTFNGCRVWSSTTQTLANATGTVITWNSESYDTNSYHSTVTNTGRLTVPSTGYYLLNTTIMYADNTTGARLAYIRKNGTSEVAYTEISSDGTVTNTVNAQIYAAANDYFEVIGYQNSGGNLATLYAGEQYNFFSAVYLGA